MVRSWLDLMIFKVFSNLNDSMILVGVEYIVQSSHKFIKNIKKAVVGKGSFSRTGKRELLLYPPVTPVARCCVLNAKVGLNSALKQIN